MDAATYTKSGARAAAATKLDKAVFGFIPSNHELLKLAYNAYLANGRKNLATTKNRGAVSGGGKKPWRQKGTGRARVGSSRVPQWRGGGVAFGPTGEENYVLRLPLKAKRQALRQALSLAAADKKIRVIETFECKEGKVSHTVELLHKLDTKGSVLLVVSQKDDLVERATNNLQNVLPTQANYLNVFDVLNADTIVISSKALDTVSAWLGTPPTLAAAKGEKA
jgi:large subunit ribosomal protein L4